MSDSIKKIISFRFDRYEATEIKLEKLAAKGLFLEECGPLLWTFKKGKPKKLKYTVTFFTEGSVFNPRVTDNQQTYFDFAAAAGWHFVTEYSKMQIFWSEPDNPIPFETDATEKLNNIKRCMKKTFLPSTIVLILIFIFNLVVQFSSFRLDPITFLSDSTQLIVVFMFLAFVVYQLYVLIGYFVWIYRSEISIAIGGDIVKNGGAVDRVVDLIFYAVIISCTGYLFLHLAFQISWFGLLLTAAQVPILMVVFWSSIKYLKKRKATARKNMVFSTAVLIIVNFAYIAVIMMIIINYGINADRSSTSRTVQWEINETNTLEYTLYNDEIPLTCEDLYGKFDYEYYSYKQEADSTYFLSKSLYRQDSLPAKDSPPEINYGIYEPHFNFVYQLVKDHLLEIPEWRDNVTMEQIDNQIFDTTLAYQSHYEGTPTGAYILLFKKKIVVLNLEEPLNTEQIQIIKENLNF